MRPNTWKPREEIDLVPLSLFSQRIAEGWHMITGYPLEPGDFAVTMSPPGWLDTRSNISRAAAFRKKRRGVVNDRGTDYRV